MRHLLVVTMCVAQLAACSPPSPPVGVLTPSAPPVGVPVTIQDQGLTGQTEVLLRGRVLLPRFGLTATPSDVADRAMVVLSAGAGPLATGLADQNGTFTLYQPSSPAAPFQPTSGYFYSLEVLKRVPTAGSGLLLSLRTFLKWDGSKWLSVSGDSIVVSLLTTAVALFQFDDESSDFDRTMGVVSGSDANAVAAFGVHSVLDLRARAAILGEMLTDDRDPGGGDSDYPTAVHTGDVTITDAASLAAAQGYGKIVGNLTLSGSEAADVDLPNLVWVTGNVTDSNADGQTALRLPKLRRVDGSVTVAGSPTLTVVDLHKLTTVGQTLSVSGLSALADLQLQGLEMVGKDMAVANLGALTGWTSARLASVGQTLTIEGNGALTSLDLPALKSVGGLLQIRQNAQLPMCQATAVRDRLAAVPTSDLTGNLGTCP
jgi:hypothetical protein